MIRQRWLQVGLLWAIGRGTAGCGAPLDSSDIPPNAVVPTPAQIAYQQMELIGFVHFTVNTFTDREWGEGDESESLFNPTALDARQWTSIAKEVGIKELILTAKHHDGFALWPSKYTDHSVIKSGWRGGHGDVVGDLVAAARQDGIKVGFYLSPWDRNRADYGQPSYLGYYRNQLRELLRNYGEVTEIWVDGANGGAGFYGGQRGERRIDRATYYDWKTTWALIKSLQPNALVFSDAGPDIHWIGNEKGVAGETNWSTITPDTIVVGNADEAYLNRGDPNGAKWVVPLCDTSIRPGWFYHASEDDKVKTPQQLIDLYYESVGRNCVLLLNVPPDRRGLWTDRDVATLRGFRRILDQTFATNLARGKPATSTDTRSKAPRFAASNIVDDDVDSYWAAGDKIRQATVELDLGGPTFFDRIMLQEPIRFGQRISRFEILGRIDNRWTPVASGTTIGYKRILRIPGLTADRVRVVIAQANNPPALSNFGLFRASSEERAEVAR